MSDGEIGDELTPELQEVLKTMLYWRTPEGQRAQRRMEEIRPQWDELGGTLVAHANLAHIALTDRELKASAAGTDPSMILVRPGSSAWREADNNAFALVNPDNALVLDVLCSLVAGAIDHLFAVGVLMMTFAPIRPTFSSARVLFEAGARTHTLAGDHLDTRLRVTRAANFRLEDLHQRKTDLTHALERTDVDGITELEQEMDRLTTLGDADDLAPQTSKKGERQTYFLPLHSAEDAANESLLPAFGRDTWRTLSSAVHLQERGAYQSFALNKIAVVNDRIRRAYAVGELRTAFFVSSQGLRSACEYLGADTATLLVHFHQSWPLWERGSMSEAGADLNRAALAQQDSAHSEGLGS